MGYTTEGIGYQKRDTSVAAANSGVRKKLTVRDLVYKALSKSKRPMSTEQIAAKIKKPFPSVQPRTSELANEGKIVDSGQRGKTQWGKPCILWEVKS